MDRVILHVDANSFYASVECLYTPSLRGRAMAVCGSAQERHGIVLAKSAQAARRGVKTGMALWQARLACPSLCCVPPDFELYAHFSRKLRKIYEDYAGLVEPFGIDECWLDISQPGMDMAAGERVAQAIRRRVRRELGITVSAGVSFNKVFAKLGSDLKKPDAVSVISRENYRETAWPLPASALLYVGPSTAQKLARLGINTIGRLAGGEAAALEHALGKNGALLKAFAMGLDRSPVRAAGTEEAVKSVGNSLTPPQDIQTPIQARALVYLLAESVARRMRALGFKAGRVCLSVRGTDLTQCARQRALPEYTDETGRIADAANALFEAHFSAGLPARSMGLSCARLTPADAPEQLSMLDARRTLRARRLDQTLDGLRYRFGHLAVRRAIVLAGGELAGICPAGTGGFAPFVREEGADHEGL